jgi:hypothetical protein
MIAEWIYIIQLAPTGYIKVGRTTSLGRRLVTHVGNAACGGSEVARVMLFACVDSATKERRLIRAVAELSGATTAYGKETFRGVTFMAAVAIADEIAGSPIQRANCNDSVQSLLAAACEVMDEIASTRMSLDELRRRLTGRWPDLYGYLTNHALGALLRRAGVTPMTVWCPARRREMKGVKREWLVLTAAA